MEKRLESSNTSQAAWIALGSLFSFLFSIVSSAVLSRYLTKDAYGTYRQVMYVYTTLLSVFTLGLPLSYSFFLPRVNISEGKTLVNKLNIAFFFLGLFFSVVLFLGADLAADILRNPKLSNCIRIFSPAPVFILPTMGLQGILATYRKTMLNTVYIVVTRVFMLLCVALPVCMLSSTVETALWGFIVSSFISMIVALYFNNIPFRQIKPDPTHITYRQIFAYSLPLMVAGLLGVAIHAADQFYVSRYFGQEVFADFANGSLELPFVGMVLSACGTVLLPVFSRMIYEETPIFRIVDLWNRTAIKAAYILYPLVVYCILFATDIMTFLYGSQYAISGQYFRIMLVANFFTIVQFYPIILALGKTRQYAIVHIVVFALVWIAEALTIWIFKTPVAVTIVSVFFKIIKIILMMDIVSTSIGVKIGNLFPTHALIKTFICCLTAGIFTDFIAHQLPWNEMKLLYLVVSFVLYSLITLLFGKWMNIDFYRVIKPITNNIFRR